jgi:probable HAF family extracellular repeat protein
VVVVGKAGSDLGAEAFRWTKETGMVGLGELPGGRFLSEATDVSADGTVIVGYSATGDPAVIGEEPFRWTQETGMVGLGHLPGGVRSSASAVSSDGGVIVGSSFDGRRRTQVFRWTESQGLMALGNGTPTATSQNGAVIVGQSSFTSRNLDAFIWDKTDGLRDLQRVLTLKYGLGASLEGVDFLSARGISDDGRTIVGLGYGPAGREQAWVAVIPEPPTDALVVVALFALPILVSRMVSP